MYQVEGVHFFEPSSGIVLRVKNAIDPETQAYWENEVLSSGKMVVTLQYDMPDSTAPNGKKTFYFTSEPVTLLKPVSPGQSSEDVYEFKGFTVVPPNEASNVEYRLIYRGKLGQEADAIAVGVFKPMSGFLVAPSYVPADGLSGVGDARLIYYTQNQWHLDKNTSVVAGNIDWKGWYVGDKPTKVLSWVGPPLRYFPAREFFVSGQQRTRSESDFSNVVYQNGEVFAVAPSNVLAAVVARDGNNTDWLIVVCASSDENGYVDVVYRRPYKKSNTAAGWEAIGNSANIRDALGFTQAADIPWFFNGAGKQAQTMRRWWKNGITWTGGLLKRLTLEISDDLRTATFGVASLGDTGFQDVRTCNANYDQSGAGGGQRTSNSSGEYVFAVDYKNDKPVLAKISIQGQFTVSSTVTVTQNQDNQKILTGNTKLESSSYRESLILEVAGGSSIDVPTFSESESFSIDWVSGGPSPKYEYTANSDTRANEVTYLLDLRSDHYGYYFWNFKDETRIANGIETETEDGDEGSILREGVTSTTLHSNTFPHFEGTRPAVERGREIQCFGASNETIRRYGTSNFGWWSFFGNALGSVSKDSQGRKAHSQHIVTDLGYDLVGTANTLSEGSFESVIPTAPPSGALFHPIQLVR